MKELVINRVIINGFKNHKSKVEYRLGNRTLIEGENGQGKTTIGEAITWCLLGCDLTGNEKATSKLMNNSSKSMEVEIDFIYEGKEYNVIRRKKGSKLDIYLNGNKVNSNDLADFYKDKRIFLSVFNPSYFPNLSPKEAKDLLLSILDTVNNEEVFKEIGDYMANVLKENGFRFPNLFLEKKREELRELEDDKIFLEGFIYGKEEMPEIPKVLEFEHEDELKKLNIELDKLNSIKIKPLHDIDDIKNKKFELERKIYELKSQKDALDPPKLINVEALKSRYYTLKDEYKELNNELKSLNNTVVCDQCGNEIDLDKSRKEYLVKRLKEIEVEGKNIAQSIKEAENKNNDLMKEYESKLYLHNKKIDDEIKKLEEEINALNIDKLIQENKKHEESELQDINNRKAEIIARIKELEREKAQVEFHNQNRENLIKQQEEIKNKIEESRKKLEAIDVKKSDILIQIDAAKKFNEVKLKLQSKNIDKYLNKVSIRLQKLVKSTGEIKDDFKIMYDNREFNVLSNSEKIKAGLEIANLIMNVTGYRFPIFIDNAESITKYKAPETQIIEARVKKGSLLKIEVA
ncbi:hypothetical protein [Caloranaerobacter sp. DY30410]|uniref:hypothetical protein n=1 Tax=Caloranaerobacter sp. DY30410 TaxID=3238305 RepID=UPI003D026D64